MNTVSRRVLILGGASLLAAPAYAHHGFGGRYDLARPIWIEGVVTRTTFAPPHPTLHVRAESVTDPATPTDLPHGLTAMPAVTAEYAGAEHEIEFPPVGTFFDLRDDVAVGDRVALIVLRNCDPPHQLRSQWIRLSNGTVVRRDNRMAYMVEGCG